MWQTLASICCTYLLMYYSPAYFKVWIFDKYEDDLTQNDFLLHMFYDWLINLAPFSQPIGIRIRTNQ